VVVVGGGIAGATIAAQLAKAGMRVTVLEASADVATAASGNLAGSCLPVIDRQHGIYAHWYWQAWQSARRWLQQQPSDIGLGDLSGAFKWLDDGERSVEWQDWLQQLDANAWMTWWTDAQAQQAISPDVPAGIWLARAGWLAPRKVVAQLFAHESITLRTNCAVHALAQARAGWQVTLHDEAVLIADAVVVATGANTGELLPEWRSHLHFQKGQVSHVKASDWHVAPSVPLTFGGYVMPPVDGLVCVGATFEQKAALGLSAAGHAHNMGMLREALPNALMPNAQPMGGHSAYRMMTVDHLPLVGPVVDVAAYAEALGDTVLRPDTCPEVRHCLVSNLWLSVGHGSRGLTSAFLAAEVLVANMTASVAPVSIAVQQAIHPARVIFRQLARQLR
jgi:tRNA 5-methylaminomethyl-2-thiouridine biosynthesis bifunctional protein